MSYKKDSKIIKYNIYHNEKMVKITIKCEENIKTVDDTQKRWYYSLESRDFQTKLINRIIGNKHSEENGFRFSMDEKELFGSFHGIMPGDKRTGTAIIKNAGSGPAVFYLRAEPDKSLKEMEGYVTVTVSLLKDCKETEYGNVAGKSGNEFSNISGLLK